ncbi:YwhD family protein [Evansella halocellulosilytica]|uniref:YwhD family protein n=1 Tax=Evansella halocellulosilytica TaxID=2011013 RepID=UPI000BB8924E|nr:YwhD family protein [Evansella halocellulosilytica]
MDIFDKKKGEKRGQGFNILSSDSTDGHGGYGAGVLNLNNMTSLFIDVEEGEAFVDMGALHARSSVEKGIKFLHEKDKVPNGKPYWLIWITTDMRNGKPAYIGVAACELTVDREIRRGYKSLPEHVNNMDKSLKGRIIVSHMDDKSKNVLKDYLTSFDENMWENSDDQLKEDLNT